MAVGTAFSLPSSEKINWTGNKELDLAFLAYSSGRFNDAFKLLSELHARGNKTATALLGRCYQQGRGVAENQAKADKLFEESANAGDSFGTLYLLQAAKKTASMASHEKNFEDINRLAASGNIPAKNVSGVLLEQKGDNCAALKQFEQAAQAGYPPSVYNLARFYEAGKCVDKNLAKASELENTAYRMGYKTSK